ncbi:MAG: glycosyltransferase family 2 protein [Paludibacteraceae bacterium]|nr:glycosyltransferase family 2 protein [Paludibacteraceae bacterium]
MIHILMSTYNGERYLREQLDSIIGQTCADWRLFVRDDGSTDGTVALLQEYAERLPERIILHRDNEPQLGAMRSFERLLAEHEGADYYMFADQDDVWLPDKVALTLRAMQEQEAALGTGTPLVVHTDLRVVDEQLRPIAPSFWQFGGIHPEILDTNIHYLAICNSVTGCAMMMNGAARTAVLPFNPHVFMHDAWIGIRVLDAGGRVVPVPQATMLYRQHGDNVCGAQRYRFRLTNLREKYMLAVRSYQTGYPLVFRNILHFLYWKTRYFFALHTL